MTTSVESSLATEVRQFADARKLPVSQAMAMLMRMSLDQLKKKRG